MGCKNRLRASKVCVRGYDEIAFSVTHFKKSFLQLKDAGIYAINCTSAKETKVCSDLIIPASCCVEFPASIPKFFRKCRFDMKVNIFFSGSKMKCSFL